MERDDVMSITDRVMGYQSFQRASTPAYVSSNVWKNGSRNGTKALGSSRHFRPLHSVLLAPVGFRAWLSHPCHSAAAMHSPQLVSACVTGQFGARCAPSTAQGLLWHVRRSWSTSAATPGLICGRPGVQSAAPCQTRWKNTKDWAARLIRVELRGEEQGSRGRNSLWLIPASQMPNL